jgi:hypothetical protein
VQAWFAVGFKVIVPEGTAVVGVGGCGMKHAVRQFAACELQFIMQLVTVDVIGVESPGVGVTTFGVACASWINSSAEAWFALQQIVAAKTIIARARMTLLRLQNQAILATLVRSTRKSFVKRWWPTVCCPRRCPDPSLVV